MLMAVMVLGCVAAAAAFGLPLSDAAIVGGCVALSSTPVALGPLRRAELRDPHGELVTPRPTARAANYT